MKVAKLLFKNGECQYERNDENVDYQNAQLVIGFGARHIIEDSSFFLLLKEKFLRAQIALSSSSGEIFSNEVYDDTVVVTVISFSKSHIKTSQINTQDFPNSFEAGKSLLERLPKEHLKWVFVLSDGSLVNGSQLVQGLNSVRPENVLISGGLAGDGDKFEKTAVGLNQIPVSWQLGFTERIWNCLTPLTVAGKASGWKEQLLNLTTIFCMKSITKMRWISIKNTWENMQKNFPVLPCSFLYH
nr:FIST N-terminal domain-containing protein [Chryseobacterium binzhouense]